MTVNFSIEILKWLTLIMKICSLKTSTILFTIFIFTAFCNTQAMQKGSLEYLENRFDYSTLNPFELIQAGDIYFEQALNTKNKLKREKFFRYAMGKYFLTSKADSKNVYPYVQMGRIYDKMQQDSYAKSSFYKATNLDYYNPYANFHFGEYYFDRREYFKALRYYVIAYQNGYENNFELVSKIGVIYEKLGDLINARDFYNKAQELNPEQAPEYIQKLQQIDSLKYDESEYYYIIRE